MKKKSKVSLLIIGMLIVLASVGLSYAYWQMTLMGDKGNNVTSGCFNIEMINQKDEITLGSTYPITDEEGLKLKPFSFTLKNTCTIFAHYYVNMEMLEGTTLNSKFVAVRVNNEEINTLDTYKTANTTIDGSTESRTIAEGYLGADEEVDYTVSFWMDEDVTIDDDVMNKVFKSKIVINSEPGKYDPLSAGYDTLHDAILANEYQTTPEIAKEKIANKQAVDLSNTAPIIKWVEKNGESTTRQVIKPAATTIKSDNNTSDLNSEEYKMRVCTTKKLDVETGKYTLSNCSLQDPTTLDYSGNNSYYYSTEFVSIKSNTNKLYIAYNFSNTIVYEIIGATKMDSTTNWNNVSYNSITYNLNTIALTETELETDKSDKGLYQAVDDYGTTYYYRGNVKNNNVYFAGFYWQIVRINGDNSVRLIYNGSTKDALGSAKNIENSVFNTSYDKPAYVGYMYGDADGSTFGEVHNNSNSSTAKIIVDDWYTANILNKNFEKYISKYTGFCGDRNLDTTSVGDGIKASKDAKFSAFGRYENNIAKYTCDNIARDLYTVENSNFGNESLTYPVGMITYDELVFAGMNSNRVNKFSWIYSSASYWTMTPSRFEAAMPITSEWRVISDGYIRSSWSNGKYGIRPVINLKSDVKITGGTGTANDPFVVDTNN